MTFVGRPVADVRMPAMTIERVEFLGRDGNRLAGDVVGDP
jgi:hypothetical protein